MVQWTKHVLRLALAAALVVSAASATARADMIHRHDTFLSRVEILALIETLNAELLASRSATTTLEAWCGAHGMAAPATLKARLVKGVDKPPTDEQRQRLGVSATEPVTYRHVELSCGAHMLSEADNWYVPARLSAAMNQLLETSDTSFGRVVAALKPTRQTFAATLLWHPLPQGWEMGAPSPDSASRDLGIPPILFEHHAILYTAERVPFSEVAEHYTSEILAFGR